MTEETKIEQPKDLTMSLPPCNNESALEGKANEDEKVDNEDPSILQQILAFVWKYEFLFLIVVVIMLARAYPPMGAEYLQPDITATWISVSIIFVVAGFTLKTEEFANAFKQVRFNFVVQVFSFGVVSSTVYAVALLLGEMDIVNGDLLNGMVLCSCLPMTTNMVVVLTKASGGDEAAAIFNTAFGNMMGVFLSPLLILGYLGVEGEVDIWTVFYKLALRVVLPLLIGQVLQKAIKDSRAIVKKHAKRFKYVQQYTIIFLVYCIFSRTFANDSESSASLSDIFIMICLQFALLSFFNMAAWYMLRALFRDQPKLRVMGLFGCTHKTIAIGIPLINAIYEDDSAVGLYTLPLLIWYPMVCLIGTSLEPRLLEFVQQHEDEVTSKEDSDDDCVLVVRYNGGTDSDTSSEKDKREASIVKETSSLEEGEAEDAPTSNETTSMEAGQAGFSPPLEDRKEATIGNNDTSSFDEDEEAL